MPDAPPAPLDPRRRLFAFLILMTAMFMAMLDNQIVATALPSIVGEFGELERFGWVGSAYLLASSSVMPIYGKLGDLFGRKRVLMFAVSLFLVGSLACGLAVSMTTLIAARVLQALGGGGIAVTVFAINADLFPPRERARYQSYTSLVLMLSGAVGPVLGGFMSHTLGWRSIFLINLPIALAVLPAMAVLLPRVKPDRQPKIDVVGAALLACVIASIVLWADASQLVGGLFTRGGLAMLALGAICFAAWIAVERRAPEPVIPLTIFRSPSVPLLLLISAVSGSVGIGLSNYWALFLQASHGLSPTHAGLMFIPLTAGIALGSVNAGRFISLHGRYKPFALASTLGSACVLTFMGLFAGSGSLALIAVLMGLQGVAIGVGQQAPVLGVQNAVDKRDVGAATGSVTLTRMGGASIGISIYGAIVAAGVAAAAAKLPGGLDPAHLDPSRVATLAPDARAQVEAVFAAACRPMFWAAAACISLGALAALALPNISLPTRND